MSLNLSVITDKKITDELLKSVIDFILVNQFRQNEYGYHSGKDNICINIYTDTEPEKDEFWTDGPPTVVWFTPRFEIALESLHTRESHETSYRIARELATLLDGFIYDNQVCVLYDSDGQPCDHYRTGKVYEKYGAGIDLFMGFAGMMNDILRSEK